MKLFLIVSILLALANIGLTSDTFAPTVQLKDGQVRGIVEQVEPGHSVYLYQGIRYGRANRFEKPRPVEPWTGVYNATKWRDACPQPGVGKPPNILPYHTETISEDCLFVSVWRPVTEKANRTVMVWIHGGGYNTGTIFSIAYDGRYLASQGDVVLVSINYRLGPFGFLFGDTKDAPGNLGLHDQILALKWVRDNVHHFGGDPNSVTIFGESAGSFAVGSLILSPLAANLFHRAILQSGAPNSYFGIATHNESFDATQFLAAHVNCTVEKIDDTVKCLRNKTVEQLVEAAQKASTENINFKPIYGDELLPVRPVEALKTGKFNHDIDLMYGVTSHEGSGFVAYLIQMAGGNLTVESTKDAIKGITSFFKQSFNDEIAQFYTNKLSHPTQDQLKIAIADTFGDLIITCPTILFAEQYAALNPNKHFYSYRLVKPTNLNNCTGWMSVCHGEDIAYLFTFSEVKSNPELAQLSRDMISAWTNFAKNGHPGTMGKVQWTEALLPKNKDAFTKYMSLDAADYKMVPEFYKQACNTLWKAKIFV